MSVPLLGDSGPNLAKRCWRLKNAVIDMGATCLAWLPSVVVDAAAISAVSV